MTPKEKISQEKDSTPILAPSESAPTRILSSEDSLVADIIREQPREVPSASVTLRDLKPLNLLEFPEECTALNGKQYRFGWLTKGKDLSAALRTRGWILCNSTNAPFIKRHRFGLHGAVEQGGMLLAFMREEDYRSREAIPAKISADRVKHFTDDVGKGQDPDAPISFYKPKPEAGDE